MNIEAVLRQKLGNVVLSLLDEYKKEVAKWHI